MINIGTSEYVFIDVQLFQTIIKVVEGFAELTYGSRIVSKHKWNVSVDFGKGKLDLSFPHNIPDLRPNKLSCSSIDEKGALRKFQKSCAPLFMEREQPVPLNHSSYVM